MSATTTLDSIVKHDQVTKSYIEKMFSNNTNSADMILDKLNTYPRNLKEEDLSDEQFIQIQGIDDDIIQSHSQKDIEQDSVVTEACVPYPDMDWFNLFDRHFSTDVDEDVINDYRKEINHSFRTTVYHSILTSPNVSDDVKMEIVSKMDFSRG